jgi:hypothetical protein
MVCFSLACILLNHSLHGELLTLLAGEVGTFKRLRELVKERILIIDGAMGTSIQKFPLTEADFRGAEFADHPKDLKGGESAHRSADADLTAAAPVVQAITTC